MVLLRLLACGAADSGAPEDAAPAPDIAAPSRVDIEAFVGHEGATSFEIDNLGPERLLIEHMWLRDDSPELQLYSSGIIAVEAWGTAYVALFFTPTTEGEVTDELVVSSDDPDEPEVVIPVYATAIRPGTVAEAAHAVITAEDADLGWGLATHPDGRNGRGDALLVGAEAWDWAGDQTGRVDAFSSLHDGSFDLGDAYDTWTGATRARLGTAIAVLPDLDGDGVDDVLAGGASDGVAYGTYTSHLWSGDEGAGPESALATFSSTRIPLAGSAAGGDVSGDGVADIALRPAGCGHAAEVLVFDAASRGALDEEDAVASVGPGVEDMQVWGGNNVGAVEIADLDGDGVGDLVLDTGCDEGARVFRGPIAGTVAWDDADAELGEGATWAMIVPNVDVGPDVDGDGLPDVAGDWGEDVGLFRGDGTRIATVATPEAHAPGPVLLPGDLDGDDLPDLVLAGPMDEAPTVWLLSGPFAGSLSVDDAALALAAEGEFAAYRLAAGQLHEDGVLDLAVASPGSDSVYVLFGEGLRR